MTSCLLKKSPLTYIVRVGTFYGRKWEFVGERTESLPLVYTKTIYTMQLFSSAAPNLYTDTMNIPSRGSAVPVMYYKPSTPSTKCLFFFNGEGETTGPVSGLAKNGPLGWISKTYQPDFSIFCIQGFGWATPTDQATAYSKMKVLLGFTQVALIGLSEGAMRATVILTRGTTDPIVKDTVAFVTMSSQADDSTNLPAIKPIVASGIAVLGSGDNVNDGHAQFTQKLINELRTANPGGNYIFVPTPGTNHGGWTADTDPSAKFVTGLSIEQWLEQFFTSGVVVTPPPTPVTIKGATISYSDGTSYTPTKAIKSVAINYADGTSETKP